MVLPIKRCLDNRSRNIRQCASNVLVDIRNTTIMLQGSLNMVFQVRVGSEDLKRYKGTISEVSRKARYNQNITKSELAESQGCYR
jgi:hypothetical protein